MRIVKAKTIIKFDRDESNLWHAMGMLLDDLSCSLYGDDDELYEIAKLMRCCFDDLDPYVTRVE